MSRRGGTTWTWKDLVSGRLRTVFRGPGGKIRSEDVQVGSRFVSVDYDARRWRSWETPSNLDPRPVSPRTAARTYRDLIASRQARILGGTTLHGRRVLHVRELETIPPPTAEELKQADARLRKEEREHLPKGVKLQKAFFTHPIPNGGFKTEHVRIDAWLDASTYLPARILTVTDGRFTTDETDSWLRRTVANLAKTRLVVPRGFTHQQQSSQSFGFMFTSTHQKPLPCHAP